MSKRTTINARTGEVSESDDGFLGPDSPPGPGVDVGKLVAKLVSKGQLTQAEADALR